MKASSAAVFLLARVVNNAIRFAASLWGTHRVRPSTTTRSIDVSTPLQPGQFGLLLNRSQRVTLPFSSPGRSSPVWVVKA
ncbi:hypothetical protein BO71DRAFT_399293, partial [Aspergillus ellipticus CBS 707.79]